MKKILIAIVLCLSLVALMVSPVMAAANKLDLIAKDGLTGGGFVIVNNSAGPNNLEVTVSLKGAEAGTYSVFLFVDGVWYSGAPVGDITPNAQGNANFHINVAVTPCMSHNVAVDVATPLPAGADQYWAPAANVGAPWGVTVAFK